MNAKAISIIVLLILLLVFALQKTQPVYLSFLLWQISLSSVLSTLVSFITGLLIVYLLMRVVRMKNKNPRLDYSRSNLFQFLLARYFEKVLIGNKKSAKNKDNLSE
jgi:uncharacterized integral membrane protein